MSDELEERVKERAKDNFRKGLNCSECVIDALMANGVIEDSPEVRAISTGFGGGMGMAGQTCGALAAAVIANSLKYGRKNPWATPDEERPGELAGKYYRRPNRIANEFIDKYGTAQCRELVAQNGGWDNKERRRACHAIIVEAAGIAYRWLQVPQEEGLSMKYGQNLAGRE